MRYFIAICTVVLTLVAPFRGAQAAATTPYNDNDVQALVRAVLRIPIDHEFLLGLELAPAADLPSWDPIAHYNGPQHIPDGRTAYAVLVDDRYASQLRNLGQADHAVGAAVASAVFLAVIDAGRAGSKWKALYERAAAADNAAGQSNPDRY